MTWAKEKESQGKFNAPDHTSHPSRYTRINHPLILLTPYAFLFTVGFLTCRLFLKKVSSNDPGVSFVLGLSAPLGTGIVTLLMFFAYCLTPKNAKIIAQALAWLYLTIIIILQVRGALTGRNKTTTKGAFDPPKAFFSDLATHTPSAWIQITVRVLVMGLFVYSLYSFLIDFTGFSMDNIFGGWDARYHWNLKARYLFREPLYWKNVFSPLVSPQLENYPLLLPFSLAWGWQWIGNEALGWQAMVGLIFGTSLAFLITGYLLRYTRPANALLAGSFVLLNPVFRFWTASQYADIPLAFYMTASTLLLVASLREKQPSLLLLSGCMAGLAAWTKNEGLLFVLILSFLVALSVIDLPVKPRHKIMMFALFISGLLIPLTAVFYLKVFLAPPDIYAAEASKWHSVLVRLFDFNRSQIIGSSLLYFKINPLHFSARIFSWNGLWIFFAAALSYAFLFFRKHLLADWKWLLPAAILLIECGYFVIFQITPIDLKFHISTALHRLMTHHMFLAIVFTFETFGLPAANRAHS